MHCARGKLLQLNALLDHGLDLDGASVIQFNVWRVLEAHLDVDLAFWRCVRCARYASATGGVADTYMQRVLVL